MTIETQELEIKKVLKVLKDLNTRDAEIIQLFEVSRLRSAPASCYSATEK